MRVLVVEDEKKTAAFVRKALQAEGFAVDVCGFGLSIAQWIAAAHHGPVKLESAPNQLTTVTVRLPLAAEEKTS